MPGDVLYGAAEPCKERLISFRYDDDDDDDDDDDKRPSQLPTIDNIMISLHLNINRRQQNESQCKCSFSATSTKIRPKYINKI